MGPQTTENNIFLGIINCNKKKDINTSLYLSQKHSTCQNLQHMQMRNSLFLKLTVFFFRWVQHILGKEENKCNKHFLLSARCFHVFFPRNLELYDKQLTLLKATKIIVGKGENTDNQCFLPYKTRIIFLTTYNLLFTIAFN